MHVLLTRPIEDGAGMQQALQAGGMTVSHAPMLSVRFKALDRGMIEGATGLIVTSRNALRALEQSDALGCARKLPVFAVGPATAKYARSLGFEAVVEGPGTAAELAEVVAAAPLARTGPLLHLCGNRRAHDLAADLAAHGIKVDQIEAYHTVAAKTLPEPVAALLDAGAINAVILMSPETARAWQLAVSAWPSRPDLTRVTHLCLSKAVAEALAPLHLQKIEIASAPNAEQILALANRLAANSKAE